MLDRILTDPRLQADQLKLYPTAVTPWTVIQKWFQSGKYVPMSEENLFELLLTFKTRVHPWIRLNRVIRDIPNQYIEGGNQITNLRQHLQNQLKKRGQRCRCVRCREVSRHPSADPSAAVMKRREYDASGGREIFLSFETSNEHVLFGFVRLRLPDLADMEVVAQEGFPELRGCALIRELHVYGQMKPVTSRSTRRRLTHHDETQHVGFGRRLMREAERIASHHGYRRIAVIAGIGTREYYRLKCGYEIRGTYMVKSIRNPLDILLWCNLFLATAWIAVCVVMENIAW